MYMYIYTCTLWCVHANVLQECTGGLGAEQVCETCFQYNLPLTADQLRLLVKWCSERKEGEGEGEEGERGWGVRYRDLLELVNWQQEPSTELVEKMKRNNEGHFLLPSVIQEIDFSFITV